MIAIGIIGLTGFYQSNKALKNVYSVNMKNSGLLNKITGNLRANRIQLLLALQHDPKNEFSVLHEHPTSMHTDLAKKYSSEIDETWKDYFATINSPEGKSLAEDFVKARAKYEKDGLEAASKAVLGGDYHETYRITFDVINPSIQSANKSLDKLIEYEMNIAKSSYSEAEKRASFYKALIIIAILIAVGTGGTIGFIIARSISISVDKLKNTALSLADGDVTKRSNVNSNDELGEISRCFNQVADALESLVTEVKKSSEDLFSASTILKNSADEIAEGSEHVASEATAVATAGEEMAATSNDIANNCSLAVDSANSASSTAESGAEIIQKTVSGMARIAQKVDDSAKTVGALGDKSEQIGEIIGTIEDIADQTNLLALNAAIEAARAGEQGRGFAVVADEVRALADRTTRATREISDMIKSIQSETESAVKVMAEGVEEVEKGTTDAARSGEALSEIVSKVNEVTGQIHQIATAAEEQTATTNEISGNIQNITEVVKKTATNSQQTAEAALKLSDLSVDLKKLVDKFKL